MKKLFAIIALVAFVGVNSYAQTASTDKKAPKKEEVKKCTEAERAAYFTLLLLALRTRTIKLSHFARLFLLRPHGPA
jgi:hypothetical protein